MSSYNNNYWHNFGQGQQQNSQYTDEQRPNYQSGSYQQNNADPNYGRWHPQATQSATPNETRAVEALSTMSNQEPAYGAAHGSNTASYPQVGWSQTRQPSANTSSTRQALPNTFATTHTTTTTPTQYGRFQAPAAQQQPYAANTAGSPTFRSSQTQPPATATQTARAAAAHQSHGRGASPPQPQVSWHGRNASNGSLPPIVPPRGQTVTPSAVHQRALHAPPPPNTNAAAINHITVDPTQVYDPYLERQREAQKLAEERRLQEAEEAARRVDQDRQRTEAERRERELSLAEEAAVKSAAATRNQSGLTRSAQSASNNPDLEGSIRDMFSRMRQFNALNPELLAKMWEEERQTHLTKSSPLAAGTASLASPPVPPPVIATPQVAPAAPPLTPAAPPKARKPRGPNKPKAPATAIDQITTPKNDQQPNKASPALPTATPKTAPPAKASASRPSSALWQPGRKQLLAEVATKWLNERKENIGRTMTPDQLAKLLDGNPSYPDLCKSIEEMGFVINRAQFARTLLTAVPDLNKPSAAPANETPQAQMANLPPPAPMVTQPSAPTVDHRVPVMRPPSPPPVSSSTPISSQTNPGTGAPPPPPALDVRPTTTSRFQTKEQAARKRTFSDFIDLAEDDSDKDDVPAPKIPAPETASYTLIDREQPPPVTSEAVNQPQRPRAPPRDDLAGKVIVDGIRRDKVARRSMYDPRTIARDILLATGRHPDMRPLNGHLMTMQFLLADHSQGVEGHKYDLATINWNILDPGEPIESDDDLKSDDGSEADNESDEASVSFSRPMSQPMSLSNGDGTMTMVEVPLPVGMRMGLRGGKRGGKRVGRPPGPRPKANMVVNYAGGPGGPDFGQNAPFRIHGSEPNNGQRGTSRATQESSRIPSSSAAAGPSGSASGSATNSQPIGYSTFRQQNITYDENGNPIKKKGRPVGWRKAVHGKEAQAAQAAQAGQAPATSSRPAKPSPQATGTPEPKRRGRPPKAVATPTQSFTEPQYNAWKCRWENCSAELHNLETLRKHIVKIHGSPVNDAHVCYWDACSSDVHLPASQQGKDAASNDRLRYTSINPWLNHIEAAHLGPMAHTLGDGPRAGLSDAYDSDSSRAYLSDRETGRMITPRATPLPDIPEAQAQDAAQQASPLAAVLRRGMPRVRGTLSESQKEDEYKLQQLEARKLSLGPLWEQGGVRLATERRRQGLYDDEDFSGEGSADDGPDPDAEH